MAHSFRVPENDSGNIMIGEWNIYVTLDDDQLEVEVGTGDKPAVMVEDESCCENYICKFREEPNDGL